MSECQVKQIKCPRCHYDSPMTVWNSINTDIDCQLKDKLLNGELFKWKCEVCELEAIVPFSTLYHDMQHRFMLFFEPTETEQDEHQAPEVIVPENLRINGYKYRVVHGMNNLREKISIFESELNDVAIERMKFFLRLNRENHIRANDRLYFYQVETGRELVESSDCQRGAIVFVKVDEDDQPTPIAFKMEMYYDYLLSVEKDPRMSLSEGVCACIDENWIMKQMQR